MKILYAEDERAMADAVSDILQFHKYTVDVVYDGKDAYEYAASGDYDGIILDIMMPKLSGLKVLEKLRGDGVNTPILLLTAKGEVEDKIEGLDTGADDYLTKPFAMGELLARVRAMLRRREEFTPNSLTLGNISLNMSSYQLSRLDVKRHEGDKEATGETAADSIGRVSGEVKLFTLPKMEYQLMELLMLNKGIYISTEDILTKVWGYDTEADLGIVWVYISYLRKRLTALGANIEIKAKRGIGYMLREIDD